MKAKYQQTTPASVYIQQSINVTLMTIENDVSIFIRKKKQPTCFTVFIRNITAMV